MAWDSKERRAEQKRTEANNRAHMAEMSKVAYRPCASTALPAYAFTAASPMKSMRKYDPMKAKEQLEGVLHGIPWRVLKKRNSYKIRRL